MKQRIIKWLPILALILATAVCGDERLYGPIDGIMCDTLVMICGDAEHTVMVGVKNLSENVEGSTRYFRFWDCAMEEWIQSSCSADCTLKVR